MFAQRLKELREETNLTQSEVAKQCNLSCQCISSLEMGTRNPTGSTIIALADLFGVTSDYLLGRSDEFDKPLRENAIQYSAEEQKLIQDYRGLAQPLKDMIQSLIKTWQGEDAEIIRRRKK